MKLDPPPFEWNRALVCILIFAACLLSARAQGPLVFYDFNNNATNPGALDLSPTFVNPGLSATDLSGGTLGFATTTLNAFTSDNLGLQDGTDDNMAGAIAADQFFSFTVSADPRATLAGLGAGFTIRGVTFSLDNLTFDVGRVQRGANDYAIRSDVDSFANDIVFANQAINQVVAPQDIDLSDPSFDGLSSVEFRIYFDDRQNNAAASSGTFIDNLLLNGNVIFEVEDTAAILQLEGSAIPTNIAIGQVASQVHGTGLRDLNNRLYRLRNRISSGGGVARTAREGRSRELAASRFVRSERKLNVQSTIDLSGKARSSDLGAGVSGSEGSDTSYSLIPRVSLPAVDRLNTPSSGWESFASFDYGNYDLDSLGQNAGLRSRTYTGTVGVERFLTPDFAVGLGFTHVENENDLSGGLGEIDLVGNAISTYASYFRNNLWGDLLYSQGKYGADINRNTFLGSNVTASPDVVAHQTTLNLGYNIPSGDRVVHGPTFRADYSWGKLEGYTERGDARANAIFEEQDYESLITTLGWQINWVHDTEWAAVRPQVRVGYGRENVDQETNVTGRLQNSPISFIQGGNVIGVGGDFVNTLSREDPGEGWMEFGAGLGFDFRNNFSLNVDYQSRFFQQDVRLHTAAIRGTWRF